VNIFSLSDGPTGRYIVVDASGRLVSTGDNGSGLFPFSYGSTDRTLVVDSLGRLVLSPLSEGLSNTNAENLGVGSGIFVDKVDNNLRFKSLAAGGGIQITGTPTALTVTALDPSGVPAGESNTASNLGAGEGIFFNKVGVDLRFKSLAEGSGITLNSSSSEVVIDANRKDHGEIYISSSVGTTISTPGTFVKIAGTTTFGFAQNFDMPTNGRLRYIGSALKRFIISSNFTLFSDSANRTFRVRLTGTANILSTTEQRIRFQNTNRQLPLGFSTVVEMSNGQYIEFETTTVTE